MLSKEIKNISSTKKDLRNFSLVIGGVLVVLSLWWLTHQRSSWLWPALLGLLIIAAGFIVPSLLKPLQKTWMILAVLMGWIMTKVILFIAFFMIFMPINLILKILKKKIFDFGIKSDQKSYWIPRDQPEFSKASLEKQF